MHYLLIFIGCFFVCHISLALDYSKEGLLSDPISFYSELFERTFETQPALQKAYHVPIPEAKAVVLKWQEVFENNKEGILKELNEVKSEKYPYGKSDIQEISDTIVVRQTFISSK